jgi:hypothetical protein
VTRTSIRILLAAAVLLLTVAGPAGSALAQEEEEPATTTAETTFAPGQEPAVVVSDAGAAADEPAWTFRFLVPTLLALSGLVLVALVIGYGVRVKGRYRVSR